MISLTIALSIIALLILAYFSPSVAKKLFPAPPEPVETTLTVSFPHFLQTGQVVKVNDEFLRVVKVNGSTITVRSATE